MKQPFIETKWLYQAILKDRMNSDIKYKQFSKYTCNVYDIYTLFIFSVISLTDT